MSQTTHVYGGNGHGPLVIAEADTRKRAKTAYHHLVARKTTLPDDAHLETVKVNDDGELVVTNR